MSLNYSMHELNFTSEVTKIASLLLYFNLSYHHLLSNLINKTLSNQFGQFECDHH